MGFSSPERAQPVWCPGPFILGRDWTRASRRVGLQQFCRAQISLCAQSEPLAGRDICCLTFLIYTSPPSHTNTRFCSPPLQTSPSPSITERARKNRPDLGTRTGGGWVASGSVTRFAEFGKLCARASQQLVWNVYLRHPFHAFRVRGRRKPGMLYITFFSLHLCLPVYLTHHHVHAPPLVCLLKHGAVRNALLMRHTHRQNSGGWRGVSSPKDARRIPPKGAGARQIDDR